MMAAGWREAGIVALLALGLTISGCAELFAPEGERRALAQEAPDRPAGDPGELWGIWDHNMTRRAGGAELYELALQLFLSPSGHGGRDVEAQMTQWGTCRDARLPASSLIENYIVTEQLDAVSDTDGRVTRQATISGEFTTATSDATIERECIVTIAAGTWTFVANGRTLTLVDPNGEITYWSKIGGPERIVSR